MIPGGGVGLFDAISNQAKGNGVSNPSLGAQYGGFRTTCGTDKTCIRNMCQQNFGTSGLAWLKAGCDWYVDWFDAADNPNVNFTEVTCPQALIDRYKGNNVPSTPGTTPPTTTYTLTANTSNGSVTGAGSFASGTSVTLRATPNSGYVFSNWTVASGTAPSGVSGSTNATLTFNMPSNNLTLQANFITAPPQVQNYTLTVNRNNSTWGTTTLTGSSQREAGSSVSITATPNTNYEFESWAVTSGTAPSGVNGSTNATLTFNMPNNNLTLQAKFKAKNTAPPSTNYTLALTPNPAAGGSVTGGGSYASGEWVTATAAANSSYMFQGWTATQGTMPQGVNAGNTSISFNMPGSNLTLQAKFVPLNSGDPKNRTDTTRIEAEEYTSKNGNNIQIGAVEDGGGGACIGYIENGYSTTYEVYVPETGAYTMELRIAGENNINISVSVNDLPAGSISRNATGGWNAYIIQALPADVQLTSGKNTIVLNFSGSVNVDYILILGERAEIIEPGSSSSGQETPIIPSRVAHSNGAQILPNGIYLQVTKNAKLELYDLRGNSVKKIHFANGVYSVQLNDLPKGLYLAKVSFGSEKKILRIPIR